MYYVITDEDHDKCGYFIKAIEDGDSGIYNITYLGTDIKTTSNSTFLYLSCRKATEEELTKIGVNKEEPEIIDNVPGEKGYLPDNLSKEDGYRAFDILKRMV